MRSTWPFRRRRSSSVSALAVTTTTGITAAQAVYVGDRQFEDVQGAKDVGMRTVWINRFGNILDPELPAPDIEVSSLLEIPALISQ